MNERDPAKSSSNNSAALDRRALLRFAAVTGITAASSGQPRAAHAESWEEGDEQCRVQQAQVSPLPELDEGQLADFVTVSETLTGQRPLQQRLAAQYLKRFSELPDYFPKLKRLFAVHKAYAAVGQAKPDDVADQIMKNNEPDADDIRAVAEQVIYLWYVSAFFLQPLKKQSSGQLIRTGPQIWIYGTMEQYEQALLWKVVEAHAPMMPGGKRNYWAGSAI